jgi:hypothetical protein
MNRRMVGVLRQTYGMRQRDQKCQSSSTYKGRQLLPPSRQLFARQRIEIDPSCCKRILGINVSAILYGDLLGR